MSVKGIDMPPRIPQKVFNEQFEKVFGFKPHGNNKKFKEMLRKNGMTNSTPKSRREFIKQQVNKSKGAKRIQKLLTKKNPNKEK